MFKFFDRDYTSSNHTLLLYLHGMIANQIKPHTHNFHIKYIQNFV